MIVTVRTTQTKRHSFRLGVKILASLISGLVVLLGTEAQSFAASNVQPLTKLSIEDVINMRRIQAAQISPDGSQVALVIEEAADEVRSRDGSYSSLWLVSVEGGDPRQLTTTPGFVSSPQWSPNGQNIAFLTRAPGVPASQISVIELQGHHLRQLTNHSSPVTSFSWSPDSRRLAYVAATRELSDPEELKRMRLGYDAIDVGVSEPIQRRQPRKLWTLDIASAESRLLEVEAGHIMSVQWSPKRAELLLTVADRPYLDWEQLRPRIMTVGSAGGTPKLYCLTLGKLQGLSWAPNGDSIAFLGSLEDGTDFFPNGLFVCREGSTPQDLSAGSTYAVESFRWMPDSHSLLVAVAEGARRSLASLSIQTRQMIKVTHQAAVLAFRSDYSVSRSTGRIAAVLATSSEPPDVWTGPSQELVESSSTDRKTGWKKLTRLNPHLERRAYGEGEIVSWKAVDGQDISGILIKPVGYRPGVRYPMIVYIHGSNGGEANDFHLHQNDWGQLLATRGYAVLLPNYRGSIMGSSQFRRSARGDYGGKDWLDVLAGVDSMIERGIADPDRVGVGGISYGGYLTNLCATRTTRFKAAVSVAGFSNWVTFHGGESSAPGAAEKLEWGKSTYENFDLLWRHSPIAHVAKSRTATLLIMGEQDPGIPVAQGTHLFRGLRHFGVPSQLIVYPREGHGLREPNHLRDYYQRILDWFDKYLENSPK